MEAPENLDSESEDSELEDEIDERYENDDQIQIDDLLSTRRTR